MNTSNRGPFGPVVHPEVWAKPEFRDHVLLLINTWGLPADKVPALRVEHRRFGRWTSQPVQVAREAHQDGNGAYALRFPQRDGSFRFTGRIEIVGEAGFWEINGSFELRRGQPCNLTDEVTRKGAVD